MDHKITKVVIITGASSGIGQACAKEFSDYGFQVVIASRNFDKLKEIEHTLNISNPNILSVRTDVSIESDCLNLIERTIERFGRIDILICNAGISMRALFKEVDIDVLKTLMNTNLWGTIHCIKYALPYILTHHGSIVGLSSIAGFMGLPGRSGYAASKFAIHGFLESLRIEHRKEKLHVMIVAPWFTASDIRKNALGADGSKQNKSPRNEENMVPADAVARTIRIGVLQRKRLIIHTKKGKIAVLLKRIAPKLVELLNYDEMRREVNSPLI